MNKTIISIIGIIIIVILSIFAIIGVANAKQETKIVKCYDRYSNEIIGQQCEEVILEYPKYVYVCVIGMVIVVSVLYFFLIRSAINMII